MPKHQMLALGAIRPAHSSHRLGVNFHVTHSQIIPKALLIFALIIGYQGSSLNAHVCFDTVMHSFVLYLCNLFPGPSAGRRNHMAVRRVQRLRLRYLLAERPHLQEHGVVDGKQGRHKILRLPRVLDLLCPPPPRGLQVSLWVDYRCMSCVSSTLWKDSV